ncbi:MAG: GMC family oxidoreductase [Candidatus Aminicenantes bacterium]|nr:GMC family oxidoreductase [Candidatus Aminicenantes bacterium]
MQESRKNWDFEFDYLVVGSGFGGSVAAMRLAQKGYTIGVVEAGRHWNADEFTRRNWNLRKFLWMPALGLHGTWRLRLLNKVFILAGAGVGGGSLNYANTLYVPPDVFFQRDSLRRLGGREEFAPFYELASRMLGVVRNPVETAQDVLLRETAGEIGRSETYQPTPVGVFFGTKGEVSADPYFEGEGPDRIGCELCGECMTGCRKDAKNSLDKNYLYFARKFGARVFAENRVIDVRPLSPDGSAGYLIRTKKTTGLLKGRRGLTFRAQGLVFAAGTMGTNALLLNMKKKGRLSNLSDHLGRYVRTNSETMLGVRALAPETDFTKGVAITSSVHPDEETHIEPVRFGEGHDAMSVLVAALTDGNKKIPRVLRWIGNELRHPVRHAKLRYPPRWAKKTIILLVMQTADNFFHLKIRRTWFFPFTKVLAATSGSDRRNPTWIPIGNEFARRLAGRIKGVAGNVISEVTINAPITAHILGGCSVGPTPEEGVIDEENHVKGYRNMFVCDGSQIPENLGVNPALSITAFSERAMSFIPPKKTIRPLAAEKKWRTDGLLTRTSVHPPLSSYQP